jgi:hypothetical protein
MPRVFIELIALGIAHGHLILRHSTLAARADGRARVSPVPARLSWQKASSRLHRKPSEDVLWPLPEQQIPRW